MNGDDKRVPRRHTVHVCIEPGESMIDSRERGAVAGRGYQEHDARHQAV